MNGSLVKFALLLSLLLTGIGVFAGDVIDSVVVTVNGVPLLRSDVEERVRFEALLEQRGLENLSEADRSNALQRLIDQELLRQQIQPDFSIPASEVEAHISELRSQYREADSDQRWNQILSTYGLNVKRFQFLAGEQLLVLRFVDERLRPAVRIHDDEVLNYYTEVLVPKLRQAHAPMETFSAVSNKIRELLVEQRVNQLLATWIANLRSESRIHNATLSPADSKTREGSGGGN